MKIRVQSWSLWILLAGGFVALAVFGVPLLLCYGWPALARIFPNWANQGYLAEHLTYWTGVRLVLLFVIVGGLLRAVKSDGKG